METRPQSWRGIDWLVGAFLFWGTAAFVLWQNTRIGILWDLSYILETAQRIAAGDIPYRDFPLPFAPLTFLTQAALIKLTGRAFFHHVLYAACAGGLGTVCAWRILANDLRDKVPAYRLCALLLAAPLIFLGIYSVFPHPFYEPDCTLAILLSILLLQRSRHSASPVWAFWAGAAAVVPLFVKQNTGLAFAGATALALFALLASRLRHKKPVRGVLWTIAGGASALAFGVVLIHFTVGLANYWHWTIEFAAMRRLPTLSDMLDIYRSALPLGFAAAFVAGALFLRVSRSSNRRWLAPLSVALLSVPFLWPAVALLIMDNSSDRVEQLLALWPFLLMLSFFALSWGVMRHANIDFDLTMLFILIAAVHGAFLSQQVWGSTYAIWPLFVLLLAWTSLALLPAGARSSPLFPMFIAVVSISLTTAGAYYAVSHERLDYAKLDEGAIIRSALPALRGLSVRGQWIPQFEQLVDFARQDIPDHEGVLMIPGEDLFYFTTGRRPQFPVIMFDHTLNPYSPEEILKMTRTRDIRWLILKNELQVNGEPVEQKQELLALLSHDFQVVKTLGIYTVYRRAPARSR